MARLPPLPSVPPPPPLPQDQAPTFRWTNEQESALETIFDWYRVGAEPFMALTGAAGTGKTTLVRAVAEKFQGVLAAMTGKAALRLSELTGAPARTLHSILYYPPEPGQKLEFSLLREAPADFIIIDESSMMTPSVFNDLQMWASKDVKILLVGDTFQLPPVISQKEKQQHGEDFSVFSKVKGPDLKTVMRNAGGVLQAATAVRQNRDICKQSYPDVNGGYVFRYSMASLEEAVELYLADPKDHMLITWRNCNRMKANKMIRERLGYEGPLPDVGEPVLIKKNTNGFLNGEIVICDGFDPGPELGATEDCPGLQTLWMRIQGDYKRILISFEGGTNNTEKRQEGEPFDGQMPWVRNFRKYHADIKANKLMWEPAPVTWGYVLTAHAAQGSQARRATVFLCQGDDKSKNFRENTMLPNGQSAPFSARWLYTAQTRSTQQTTVLVG